ncbi:MAG: hypothetical protein HGB08_02290 [Candidatus Moranbacteria bacterium]|nr:hypothetical protein [Candidatus Moranbacteria bacterium]
MIKIRKIIIKTANMKKRGYQENMSIATVVADRCISAHSLFEDASDSGRSCLEKSFHQ